MWSVVVALALVALHSVSAGICPNTTTHLDPNTTVTIEAPIDSTTNLYKKDVLCKRVFVSNNYRVSFILSCPSEDFDIKKTKRYCSNSDHLRVKDNISIDKFFCGNRKPGLLMSGGPYLMVKFRSRKSGSAGEGFKCNVTSVEDLSYTTSTSSVPPAVVLRAAAERDVAPPFVPKKGYKCTCGATRTSRIIGGKETTVEDFPWVVGIFLRGETRPRGTGVLISDRNVLTSRIPAKERSNLQVHVAETDVTKVSRIVIRDATVLEVRNDVAVLNLTRPVNLGSKLPMRPVCMPNDTSDFASTRAEVTGFGGTRSIDTWSPVLKTTMVPLVGSCSTNSLCSSADTKLCNADSGGPLVVEQEGRVVLAGLVPSLTRCSNLRKFISVKDQLDWLENVVEGGVSCRYTYPTNPPSSL